MLYSLSSKISQLCFVTINLGKDTIILLIEQIIEPFLQQKFNNK